MKLSSSLSFLVLVFSASFVAGNRSIQPAIIGDKIAKRHSHPWMAALYKENTHLWNFFCGGSLISQRYVLTKADCVASYENDASKLRVLLGVNSRLSIKGKVFSAEYIKTHPNYDERKFDYDIAIIRLTEDVPLSYKIQPVKLDFSGTDLTGKKVIAVGWGKTKLRPWIPIFLREVEVSVVSQEQCNASYSSLTPSQLANGITDKFICARAKKGGKDFCEVNTGGPLLFQLPDGTWNQVGITSFNRECGYREYPGVYTNVTSYFQFLYYNTDLASSSPETSPEPSSGTPPEPSPEPSSGTSPEPSAEPSSGTSPEPSAEPSSGTSPEPSADPSSGTSPEPSPEPSSGTSPEPSAEPSSGTSPEPSPQPSSGTSPEPSPEPSSGTSPEPSDEPSSETSHEPSREPSCGTSPEPSPEPSSGTSPEPSAEPSSGTSPEPSAEPSSGTSPDPSPEPFSGTSPEPSPEPSSGTSPEPSDEPSSETSHEPSREPSCGTSPVPSPEPSSGTPPEPSSGTSPEPSS